MSSLVAQMATKAAAAKALVSGQPAPQEQNQPPADNDTDTDSVIEKDDGIFIPPGAYHSTRIKRLFRANGRVFNPDENGYYVTDEPELIAQLEHFTVQGLVSKGDTIEEAK